MNYTAVLLLITSFVVLLLSMLSWRLTSSRSVVFNGMFGGLALLLAAYFSVTHDVRNHFLTYVIPFVVGMAFVGRCTGLLMRVKKEPQLKLPAYYLLAAGIFSTVASVVAYLAG